MGWTSTRYDKTQGGVTGFMQREMLGDRLEILDSALVKRGTWYAAVRNIARDEVFGVVVLVRWSRDPYYNITYKDMDESMGPSQAECPERILKLLDARAPLPTLSPEAQAEIARLKPLADYDHKPYSDPDRRAADLSWATLDPQRSARGWRDRCWALIHARQQAPKVKIGDVIRFENPITLTIGKVQEFRIGVGRFGKGIRLYTLWDIPCRIGSWRQMPYSIQTPQEVVCQ